MPTPLASATKANVRSYAAGAERMGGTTTSAGTTGGTTAVDADWSTYQVDFFRGKYLLLTSGTASGQWRLITDFTSSTGTFTVAPQFGTAATPVQVASAVTFEVYAIRPDLYTIAANRAVQALYPLLYRPLYGFIIPTSDRDWYDVPIARDILRVLRGGSRKIKDLFDRADSTTSAGGNWTATSATWGVISERLYSVTDTDGNLLTQAPNLKNGYIRAIVRGTLASGATYRSPALAFRIAEDYLAAIDTTNYLLVRLLNGVVDLRKVDASTESSLATGVVTTSDGVDYVVQLHFAGPWIRVWVDGSLLINYELAGLNLKYTNSNFIRVGVRWDKGGSPATAARIDDYYAYDIADLDEYGEWRQDGDRSRFQLGYFTGQRIGDDELLYIDGRTFLTALASDTTFGTIASDTTATLEIETTDPAWELFIDQVRAEVYELAADPAWQGNLQAIPYYEQKSVQMRQRVEALKPALAMPRPPQQTKHLAW